MRRIIILSVTLLFILPLLATQDDSQKEGAGGIVVGEGYAIALGAPPGWIFETKLALQRGARVVIYPADEGIDSTPVTIYVNVFALQGVSLEAWLTQDIADLEDEYPGIKVNRHPDLVTSDSITAVVREFDPADSDYPVNERVAYIRLGKQVAIISLSAHTQASYDESIEAFEYVITGFSDFRKELMKHPGNE